jgi:hypothetical protein
VNVRSYVILAAIVTAASILPAAANAAGSRAAPVNLSGTTAWQTRAHTTGLAGDTSKALTLQQRLNLVKADKAKLTKRLRTVKADAARTGANLRTLVETLRAAIAADQRTIDQLWAEILRLRALLPPPPPTDPPTDYEKCMSNMDDCTPELLCSIYGMNCDQLTPVAPTPIVETPVETPISNDAGGTENTGSSQTLDPVEGPVVPDPYGYYDEC